MLKFLLLWEASILWSTDVLRANDALTCNLHSSLSCGRRPALPPRWTCSPDGSAQTPRRTWCMASRCQTTQRNLADSNCVRHGPHRVQQSRRHARVATPLCVSRGPSAAARGIAGHTPTLVHKPMPHSPCPLPPSGPPATRHCRSDKARRGSGVSPMRTSRDTTASIEPSGLSTAWGARAKTSTKHAPASVGGWQ